MCLFKRDSKASVVAMMPLSNQYFVSFPKNNIEAGGTPALWISLSKSLYPRWLGYFKSQWIVDFCVYLSWEENALIMAQPHAVIASSLGSTARKDLKFVHTSFTNRSRQNLTESVRLSKSFKLPTKIELSLRWVQQVWSPISRVFILCLSHQILIKGHIQGVSDPWGDIKSFISHNEASISLKLALSLAQKTTWGTF